MVEGEQVQVRQCAAADVEPLEQHLPSRGTNVHADFLSRQQAGEVTYLIACVGGTPVGSAVIRWVGPRHPETRAALGAVPEISNVTVVPARQQRGVGTRLMAAAEGCIRTRGCQTAAIAVADDNASAARLYARLGYREAGLRVESRYAYPDETGVLQDIVEHDRVLLKRL